MNVCQRRKLTQRSRVEMLSGECPGRREGTLDRELLDKGSKPRLPAFWSGLGQSNFRSQKHIPGLVTNMWERGDVPRVAGQGTGNEAGNVVDQVTNDNFDNFLGKSGCGGKMNSRLLWNIREDVFNPGFWFGTRFASRATRWLWNKQMMSEQSIRP